MVEYPEVLEYLVKVALALMVGFVVVALLVGGYESWRNR